MYVPTGFASVSGCHSWMLAMFVGCAIAISKGLAAISEPYGVISKARTQNKKVSNNLIRFCWWKLLPAEPTDAKGEQTGDPVKAYYRQAKDKRAVRVSPDYE